jgi:uncharacterized ParB-like nuclease family protein
MAFYAKGKSMKALIISNAGLGDTTFDSDRGSWNVTRALRDCLKGIHRSYTHDIAETIEASKNVTVDEEKIASMVADPVRLKESPPIIFVVDGHDNGRPIIWLIDGHHRVRALQRLGHKLCLGFVIEQLDSKPYRIYFNGQRVAPWIENETNQTS